VVIPKSATCLYNGTQVFDRILFSEIGARAFSKKESTVPIPVPEMTTSPPNLTELAQQGNPEAIATLMNRLLQPKGITAQVKADLDRLQIRLESAHVPNQSALVKFVYSGLSKLNLASVRSVQMGGYQTGDSTPVWEEEIDLATQDEPLLPTSSEALETADAAQSALAWRENLMTTVEHNPRTLSLAAVALLLGLGAIAYSALLRPDSPSIEAEIRPTVAALMQSSSPNEVITASPAAAAHAFREAVNKAMQAATETQIAATAAQWQQIVGLWQEAITLLADIPEDDANHSIAQQKIGEYQRNLSYAQQQVQALTPSK
jgi:hypothetical protein